eukprot:CAMPEP_0116032508 /NCGR_PEP_ID=MMETSP0321-20121206/18214_1 /TAXON_ID=163516 /ORGANISM="Leptocylindrus danicus var. danicus, Strain B650" /LENGTH=343 /DNA_ID=CAMNT_0003507963 /DNA_START=137 /DNA_END=1169 /DNA_ORIENTATION=-
MSALKTEKPLSLGYVDQSTLVTKANHSLRCNNNTKQDNAQHGTLSPEGVRRVLEMCLLNSVAKDDVVVDIGSGTGMVLCQMAATTSCQKAVGIEIDRNRCNVAKFYKEWFQQYLANKSECSMNMDAKILKETAFYSVHVQEGDFTDPSNMNLLRSATVMYCNNFNEIFGVRTRTGTGYTLDYHLASAFAGTKPGTRLITLESLNEHLGDDVDLLNKKIAMRNKKQTCDATFFKYKKFDLGSLQLTSWGGDREKRLYAHMYTRTEQSGTHPLWLGCGTDQCEGQQNPTKALDEVNNLLTRECAYCGQEMRLSRTRYVQRRKMEINNEADNGGTKAIVRKRKKKV